MVQTSTGCDSVIIIEAALNGGRSRREHPAVPCSPKEVTTDAEECRQAGASVVHIHAQTPDGSWLADSAWYAEACRRIRALVPDLLISITSIRPDTTSVDDIVDMVLTLSNDVQTKPDLVSVNLGHLTQWIVSEHPGASRTTVHFPNSYEDIARVLRACEEHQIVPEFGIMDLGFLSNAVTLYEDGLLGDPQWFLIELDSPEYGSGAQVAPSWGEHYDLFAGLLRAHFPDASWAAHGAGEASFDIVRRAIADSAHVRVGIEDAVRLPSAGHASSNAEQVAWAAREARAAGRRPATPSEARAILGATQ